MSKKSKAYKSLVRMYKETASGMPEMAFQFDDTLEGLFNELITEGLIRKIKLSERLGSLVSHNWFAPITGYCVWDEKDEDIEMSLAFMEVYLGRLDYELYEGDDEDSVIHVLQSPSMMQDYLNWLTRNHTELEVMRLFPDIYPGSDSSKKKGKKDKKGKKVIKGKKTIDILKSCPMYVNDRIIKDCIDLTLEEMMSYNERIIELTERKEVNELNEEDSTHLDILELAHTECKLILDILGKLEPKKNIQNELNKYEKNTNSTKR